MEFETNHNGIAVPQSRYIVPQFEERTSYGTRSLDNRFVDGICPP